MVIRSYRHTDFKEVCRLWNVVFPDPKPHNEPATIIEKNLQILAGNDEVVSIYQKLGYNIEDRISMGNFCRSNLWNSFFGVGSFTKPPCCDRVVVSHSVTL